MKVFILKGVGQICFFFFAIVTNCKAFKINSHSVRSFLDLLRARREIVEKGKTSAIQYKLQSIPSPFKVKSLRQIFFPRSFARAAKLLKRKERYCYKLQSIFKSFQSKNTRSLNLLRAAKLLRRKERYCYKLQSIQQSFQSKITRSDIFPQSFARAAKLLRRKDRYFYKLQSIFKSFQSKNTRSLNLLRARQNY